MTKNKTKETEKVEEEIETKLENKNPIGILFDSMNYYSNDDLDTFINSMNHEQALYCIIEACKCAYKRNTYNLVETEIISKCLRIITKEK